MLIVCDEGRFCFVCGEEVASEEKHEIDDQLPDILIHGERGELPYLKKDFHWTISGVDYVARNVPYIELDAEGAEFLDLGDSIKLEFIRELMLENKIPHDVNYDDVADIEF